MPRRPTIARKTKYEEQLTGTALTLDQFTNKLMHGGKRHLAHRILEDALARCESQTGDGDDERAPIPQAPELRAHGLRRVPAR